MMKRCGLLILLFATACDLLPVEIDRLGVCSNVCNRIDECNANPPNPQIGNFNSASSGEEGLDCAVNCPQEDGALYGYSDCQLDCLMEAPCDQMNQCWRPKSDLFAEYCLKDRDIKEVKKGENDKKPTNGSNSGSEDADEMLDDPAAEIAIDGAQFDVNFGDTPPKIEGHYGAYGTIDEASNARPKGSVIDTNLCFWNQTNNNDGYDVSYCEDYVPGIATAPVTGTDDEFTIYLEYPGQATLLFSGKVDNSGHILQSETLVVYTHSVDVWEHSVTDWSYGGECDVCL